MVEIGTQNIRGCKPSSRYQKFFDKNNLLYFEGSLPSTRVLTAPLLKIPTSQKEAAEKKTWIDAGWYGLTGVDEHGDQCIILDRGMTIFHSILAKQTVLHEMIHIYLGTGTHGKNFKIQIRRIAALGALDRLI